MVVERLIVLAGNLRVWKKAEVEDARAVRSEVIWSWRLRARSCVGLVGNISGLFTGFRRGCSESDVRWVVDDDRPFGSRISSV
jgi:hypothetical protein